MEDKVLTDDVFEERYKPKRNHLDDNASWSGWMYETYGAEEDYIYSLDPEHVWTVVDGESDDKLWIIAGRCYVNRLGYITTEIPWESGDEQFICD